MSTNIPEGYTSISPRVHQTLVSLGITDPHAAELKALCREVFESGRGYGLAKAVESIQLYQDQLDT